MLCGGFHAGNEKMQFDDIKPIAFKAVSGLACRWDKDVGHVDRREMVERQGELEVREKKTKKLLKKAS